ncbi:LOW QUALITY PROTEIN: hypothetical protein Cgig2_033091 [Carnegiea gigantea]|uniref:Uncharacterized protein n=1 Tax=Carnegiea gigantea TaxID=171969 RepID=A0A9Q1JN53_9CARY|nr:LOW QUALITY PROTEIN: hypothetical protein Cgig2_033091 [Carnegiea gigantea]
MECSGQHKSMLLGCCGSLGNTGGLSSTSTANSHGIGKRGFVAIPFTSTESLKFLSRALWLLEWLLLIGILYGCFTISGDADCWHTIGFHNDRYMPISLPSARYVPLDVEPLLSSLQVSTDAVSLRYNEYEQDFGTYKSMVEGCYTIGDHKRRKIAGWTHWFWCASAYSCG